MMKKSSSRLIAWLLAMVMILNLAPAASLADTSNITIPIQLGNPAEITVSYTAIGDESNFGNKTDSGDHTLTASGDQPAPAFDYWNAQANRLAGWSADPNYNGTGGVLFAPGSYIDFNRVTVDEVETLMGGDGSGRVQR